MLITAFLMGIMGSFHCLGMCGPIMFAFPQTHTSKAKKIIDSLLYHLGRAFGYGALGLVMGAIGSFLNIFVLQQYISIGVGLFLLVYFILSRKKNNPALNRFEQFIQRKIVSQLSKKGKSSKLYLGFANALLPCGLSFLAATSSIAIGNIAESFMFMVAFGLGTIPMMVLVMLMAGSVSMNLKHRFGKVVPIFTICISLLFVIRGLGIGIPYVSPKINIPNSSEQYIENEPLEVDCH